MLTEFELIERFVAPFERRGAGVVLGPGDDCAVLRPAVGADLCVTTDAVVEGVHFDPALASDSDVGHKALAVNLSDLAAMGAVPRWFVCSVALKLTDVGRVPAIARGMARLAARTGIVLAGGNFTRGDALALHVTAAGEVPRGKAITRSGARAGDRIYVTGTLGDAALALALKRIGRAPGATLARQSRPEPQLAAGFVARRFASAAIDVSDGLMQDLAHVARQSGVGVRIDARRVPVSRAFKALAANPDLALTGGEDYELVVFVPKRRAAAFERAAGQAGVAVTYLGDATRAQGVVVAGATRIGAWGHDHFA